MAEQKDDIPREIGNNESLLRAVSTPSCLDADNRVTHLAFRLRNGESDLSLVRLLYDDLIAFLKKAFRFKFTFLSPKDVFAGAVELEAGVVKDLDEHIVLKATPSLKTPSHASIYFKNQDGTNYVGINTTEPVDSSILGYELALASTVRKVYNTEGKVIWLEGGKPEEGNSETERLD